MKLNIQIVFNDELFELRNYKFSQADLQSK